jgi:hypothetical protein
VRYAQGRDLGIKCVVTVQRGSEVISCAKGMGCGGVGSCSGGMRAPWWIEGSIVGHLDVCEVRRG